MKKAGYFLFCLLLLLALTGCGKTSDQVSILPEIVTDDTAVTALTGTVWMGTGEGEIAHVIAFVEDAAVAITRSADGMLRTTEGLWTATADRIVIYGADDESVSEYFAYTLEEDALTLENTVLTATTEYTIETLNEAYEALTGEEWAPNQQNRTAQKLNLTGWTSTDGKSQLYFEGDTVKYTENGISATYTYTAEKGMLRLFDSSGAARMIFYMDSANDYRQTLSLSADGDSWTDYTIAE